MSRILHRDLRAAPPVAVGGQGIMLHLSDGRSIIDAAGGAAVACVGHGHPRVIAAMAEQARRLAYTHSATFTNAAAEALAERLVGRTPGGLTHAYFVSSG